MEILHWDVRGPKSSFSCQRLITSIHRRVHRLDMIPWKKLCSDSTDKSRSGQEFCRWHTSYLLLPMLRYYKNLDIEVFSIRGQRISLDDATRGHIWRHVIIEYEWNRTRNQHPAPLRIGDLWKWISFPWESSNQQLYICEFYLKGQHTIIYYLILIVAFEISEALLKNLWNINMKPTIGVPKIM